MNTRRTGRPNLPPNLPRLAAKGAERHRWVCRQEWNRVGQVFDTDYVAEPVVMIRRWRDEGTGCKVTPYRIRRLRAD